MVRAELIVQLIFNEVFWIPVLFRNLTLVEELLKFTREAIGQVVCQEYDGLYHAVSLQHVDHFVASVHLPQG